MLRAHGFPKTPMSPNAWRNRPLPPRAGEGWDGGKRSDCGQGWRTSESSMRDDFLRRLTVRPHPTLPRNRGRAFMQRALELLLPPRAGEGRDGGERSGCGAEDRAPEGPVLGGLVPRLTACPHPTLPRKRGRALIQRTTRARWSFERARDLLLPPLAGEGWDGGERPDCGQSWRTSESSMSDDFLRRLTVRPHPTLPRLRGRALASGAMGVCGVSRAHAATPASSPANSASSACTRSGAKRHARTPGASLRLASSPRQNRYRAPPKSRA